MLLNWIFTLSQPNRFLSLPLDPVSPKDSRSRRKSSSSQQSIGVTTSTGIAIAAFSVCIRATKICRDLPPNIFRFVCSLMDEFCCIYNKCFPTCCWSSSSEPCLKTCSLAFSEGRKGFKLAFSCCCQAYNICLWQQRACGRVSVPVKWWRTAAFITSGAWGHGRSHQEALLPASSHAGPRLASHPSNFLTAMAGAKSDFLIWQVKPHIMHMEETRGGREGLSPCSHGENATQPPNSSLQSQQAVIPHAILWGRAVRLSHSLKMSGCMG